MSRIASCLVCLLAACLLGCAGYKLGPSNGVPAGSRSLQVNLFQNQTFEPRLTESVGTALRRRIQQDGTYRLDTRGSGDVVVNGVITEFNRLSLSFQPQDTLTPRDLELRMTAHVTVLDRVTGKTILDRDVTSRAILRSQSDLGSAERQAIPLLAEDLARNLTSLLVDGAW